MMQLNGAHRVGLPWQSLGGFLRIATNPRVLPSPLPPALAWQQVERRAAEQGISLAEYVRRAVRHDLSAEAERPKAHISVIFGLGRSGGSNVAKHKDRYVGEAVEPRHRLRRRLRRLPLRLASPAHLRGAALKRAAIAT